MSLTPSVSTKNANRTLYFNGPFSTISNPDGSVATATYFTTPAMSSNLLPLANYSISGGFPSNVFAFLKTGAPVVGIYYPVGNDNPVSGQVDYSALKSDHSEVAWSDGNSNYQTFAISSPTTFSVGSTASLTSLSLPAGYANNLVSPVLSYNYTTGLGILCSNATPVIGLRDIAGNANYGAFFPNNPANNPTYYQMQTLSSGGYNYTLVNENGVTVTSSSDVVWFSKWQTTGLGSSTATNYSIALSDSDDDAVLQAAFANTAAGIDPGYVVCRTGGNDTFLLIIPNDALGAYTSSQTVFVFSADFSTYDRLDISISQTLFGGGLYYQDASGDDLFTGQYDVNFYYQVGSNIGPPVDSARPLRGWTFTQDDHDFYVLRLTDSTYVFDKLTSQWCQWASPGLNYWSGSDGCDWQGFNVCCDPQTGDIHVIDPNGRLDDGTTPISTRIYGFVTTRFRKNVPMYMAEAAISEGLPPSGIDATTLGITLRTSDTLTWTNHGTVPGKAAGNMVTARWYGLGVATAPGVEFEIADTGYARRLDGLTIELGAAAEAAISNGQ